MSDNGLKRLFKRLNRGLLIPLNIAFGGLVVRTLYLYKQKKELVS
jgi:hypothetical protein